MTFSELRTAVAARGFDHITTTEMNRWINVAYQEVCEEAAWPFLEVSTTGTAPLTVADVRAILSVSDTTQGTVLSMDDRRNLVAIDPELDQTGTPTSFYLDNGTIRVYPLNTTDTLAVRYLKTPTDLSADSDTPVVPTRYQELIIDGAVIRCYKSSDETEAAASLRAEWDAGIQRMRKSLLGSNLANSLPILITDPEGWSV